MLLTVLSAETLPIHDKGRHCKPQNYQTKSHPINVHDALLSFGFIVSPYIGEVKERLRCHEDFFNILASETAQTKVTRGETHF